jgi:tetratricopeptide (TPR) repeat protein
VDRVVTGLEALYKVVEGTSEGSSILRYALRQLDEAYPRSPEFWSRKLGPQLTDWPEVLQGLVADRWLLLRRGDTWEALIPADLAEVWHALDAQQRSRIEDAVAAGESTLWHDVWNRILLGAVPDGFAKAKWPQQLQQLKRSLEEHLPGLRRDDRVPLEQLAEAEQVATPREEEPRKRGVVSGFAEFERVTKVLADIQERLERGDLERAQKFLTDLVETQKDAGTSPELIVKTLSNVAATALQAGFVDWAEELYGQARTIGVDDPVSLTGLAEVLKERGELQQAEALYRETVAQWPNNRVIKHALANLLRKTRDFTAALELLPTIEEPSSRQDFYDLHLRGMILLDAGEIPEAVELFEGGLKASRIERQRQYFHSALAIAKLKQESYDEALRELDAMGDATPEARVLRLHAAAGATDKSKTRDLYSEMSAKVLQFRRLVQRALRQIERAWRLPPTGRLHKPSPKDLASVFDAELDMLVAT